MDSFIKMQPFSIQEEQLIKELETTIQDGLSSSEVLKRQNIYGLNEIKQKRGTHLIIMFLGQFNQPLIYILLAASIITAFLKEWVVENWSFSVSYSLMQ
jgi:cation-transporting P-type ATPase F